MLCHNGISSQEQWQMLVLLIKRFWEVSRSNHNDTFIRLESIHFNEELIECLFHILLIPVASLPAYSIQFINEDDCRLLLTSSCKEITNPLCTYTHKHFLKFRSRGP